jgi:hypothetical protein
MCDYSLMTVPNRLAQDGEILITHRFQTGSLGLTSPADLKRVAAPVPMARQTFWARINAFFNPPRQESVCAVCIPPGARLRLENIPDRLQAELCVTAAEEVTFTQLSAAVNTYRDAVRFQNGREIRLQELREGMRVTVVDLSMAEELDLEQLQRERREFVLNR